MSRINRISCTTQADGSIDITIPASMAEHFKLMVKKGTNLSPDMHVEIRDFTDRLFERDHIVGRNMKEELEVVTTGYSIHDGAKPVTVTHPEGEPGLAKRSCCGTLLCEPHQTQCHVITGKKS